MLNMFAPALLVALLVSVVAGQSFVLGSLESENSSYVVRSQGYGALATDVAFRCGDCVITHLWVDEQSHKSFFATESLSGGSGGIHIGSRPIWVFGRLIAGAIFGMAGSRALNSPSIYWVWRPTAPTSPPFNNLPALYRVPWNGGIPEVVSLHAQLCKQMTIVDETLYCLSLAGSFFQFALTKPNSAFAPMTLPSVPGSARGFVVSRQRVLFVQGDDGRLYRSDAPAGSASVALPRNTSSPWAPTLYNAPTDRLVLSVAGQLLQYTGMETFWSDLLSGAGTANASALGRTSLVVVAFSAAAVVAPALMAAVLGAALVVAAL